MDASPEAVYPQSNRTALKNGVDDFKRWLCLGCGFLYDEALGLPEHGIAPGTRWDDLPDDWSCPDCGTPKNLFEMVEIPYADAANDDDGREADDAVHPADPGAHAPQTEFVLRANERGHGQYDSTGEASSYISGHPNAILSRQSSFNFHEYQSGHAGFGQIRVFGDEVFSGTGCGYNIHPHHNFVICAFVLEGELTHVNTVGNIDQLHAGDFYVFSAGSGGKHTELNLKTQDMSAIYIWFKPGKLLLPPSYHRAHFEAGEHLNTLTVLVGDDGMLPMPQQVRISRLVTDKSVLQDYAPASPHNGTYVFVVDGGIECAGHNLRKRDSIGLPAGKSFALRAEAGSDVLVVETVM